MREPVELLRVIPRMGCRRVPVRASLPEPHLRTELSHARRCNHRAHARLAQTRYHGAIDPVVTYCTERWHCT